MCVQDNTISKWKSWDLNSGLTVRYSMQYFTVLISEYWQWVISFNSHDVKIIELYETKTDFKKSNNVNLTHSFESFLG